LDQNQSVSGVDQNQSVSGVDQNQSVSGVTIFLMQRDTSPSHGVDQAVDCGLWNVFLLLFNVCVKLLDIGVLLHLHCLPFGVLGWVSVQHFEISADVRRAT
jgi:hypothetical protein